MKRFYPQFLGGAMGIGLLIAMLFLNAGGIKLSPRLPPPTPC